MNANLPDDVLNDPIAIAMAKLMAAANRQARDLGVDASRCLISISQDARDGDGTWRVNYGAKEPVGRRGGDLIVQVSPTDYSIARVLRGQ